MATAQVSTAQVSTAQVTTLSKAKLKASLLKRSLAVPIVIPNAIPIITTPIRTIVSWNVLTDAICEKKTGLDDDIKRHERIAKHLGGTKADVILLQEVTPNFLKVLYTQKWAENSYYTSIEFGTQVTPYGIATLSNRPFEVLTYTFGKNAHKKATVALFKENSGLASVTNVHLPAGMRNQAMRLSHMRIIAQLVSQYPSSTNLIKVVGGDWNLNHECLLEEKTIPANWVDASINSDTSHTFDPLTNALTSKLQPNTAGGRFDRIYVVGAHEPFAQYKTNVLRIQDCSDHYPLMLSFEPTVVSVHKPKITVYELDDDDGKNELVRFQLFPEDCSDEHLRRNWIKGVRSIEAKALGDSACWHYYTPPDRNQATVAIFGITTLKKTSLPPNTRMNQLKLRGYPPFVGPVLLMAAAVDNAVDDAQLEAVIDIIRTSKVKDSQLANSVIATTPVTNATGDLTPVTNATGALTPVTNATGALPPVVVASIATPMDVSPKDDPVNSLKPMRLAFEKTMVPTWMAERFKCSSRK